MAAIDVGYLVTTTTATATNRMVIDLTNPANLTGKITSIVISVLTALTGFRVGTFFLVSGTTYQCRDSATIGNVSAETQQTISGFSIAVEAGDLIGCFWDTGIMYVYTAAGGGWLRPTVEGEYIDPGDQTTYNYTANRGIIYGIGATPAGGSRGFIID